MANTILFFGCIIAAVVIGLTCKINIGLVALAFAFLLGTTVGGMSAGSVVGLFPTALFLNFLLATFLFGFAGRNGTLKKLSQHLIYASRNAGWLLGLLFFLVTVLIAALGAGGAAPFFLSAICFSLAIQAGINPLLVPLAVWTGSMVGGSTTWTSGFATNIGQLEIYYEEAVASGYVMKFFIFRAVFYTIVYVAAFLLLKGWKVNKKALQMEKPAAFDKHQKDTLAIILAVIVLIVVPSALALAVPALKMITKIFTFQFLATLGILANIVCKTAPYQEVVKENVPWDTLLMLSLTGVYMALATSLGVVDYMSTVLQNSVPAGLIIPGIVLFMCVLSFFVSGGVIVPMMLPLLSVLSAASGVSVDAIYCATQMGLTGSSISPFSQGGAAALTGCADEELRQKLIRQQTILSGVFTVLLVIVACLGAFTWL